MIGLLVLAAAAQPVEVAERAFASMAQTKGQWTAFRAFAAPDAIMMVDGPQPAAPFLKDRADPPVAVMWWPARTITSCDGTLAFSTGPWRRNGGKTTGRFVTIWQRQTDGGWKWIYDGGVEDIVGAPARDRVQAIQASCGAPTMPFMLVNAAGPEGVSKDGTFQWSVKGSSEWSRVGPYRLRVWYNRDGNATPAIDLIVG